MATQIIVATQLMHGDPNSGGDPAHLAAAPFLATHPLSLEPTRESTTGSVGQWLQAKENLEQIISEYNHAITKLSNITAELPRRLNLEPGNADFSAHSKANRCGPFVRPDPRVSPRHIARPRVNSGSENNVTAMTHPEIDIDVMHIHADEPEQLSLGHILITNEDLLRSTSPSSFNSGPHDELYTRSFRMKPDWELKDSRAIVSHIQAANGSAKRDRDFICAQTNGISQGLLPVSSLSRRVVASPDRHFRVAWELLGISLAMYDMIWVPLILAYDPEMGSVRKVISWFGRIFWTLNVPMTLTTGYVDDGRLIMDLEKIAGKYLKTWFIVDILTIPPDWMFLFLGDGGGAGSVVKILRSLRTLRLFRLARLVKLRNAWTYIYDSIDSEQVGIFLEVLKMVLVLMLVNHYNACLWSLIGKANSRKNWMIEFGYDSTDRVDWLVQYVVAYHWSITQFTPSSMHVQPQNPGERVFAIFVVIFGLVGFSYLVGSITSSMGRLRAISELKTTSFWHLRKFMRRNHVQYQLSTRIKSYVENRWADQHNNMRLANMEFLDMLSENLKGELALELHGHALRIHPLLAHLSEACAGTIQRVAILGVGQLCLAPRDVMFHAGEEATHMSLVNSGQMHYTRVHQEKCYPELVNSCEDWIAEPVLWVNSWRHLGDLRSTETTELLMVSAEKLAESASLNPLALWTVHHYARSYTEWLNSTDPSRFSDITQGEERSSELKSFVPEFDHSADPEGTTTHASRRTSAASVSVRKDPMQSILPRYHTSI